jgi:ABC-type polysaccharide/polyol phosphate export permease
MKKIKTIITDFKKYKELIWHLAKTDFKLRYHGSTLGYLWTILEPLLLFAVIYIVFSNFRGFKTEYYALQLITAIMVFNFFTSGSSSAINCLRKQSNLLLNIKLPNWIFIISTTLYNLLIFLMNLIVIIFFFICNLYLPSLISIMFFVIYLFVLIIIVMAFGFLLSSLSIKFRDISHIWKIITRVLFYATPIIWPLSMIPEQYQKLVLINPLAFIAHYTKVGLIGNHNPDFWQWIIFLASSIVFFFISVFIYTKTNKKIIESL